MKVMRLSYKDIRVSVVILDLKFDIISVYK